MGQHPLEARDERRSCFRDTALHMPCCANPRRPRCPRHPTLGCTTLEWSRLLMTLRPWHCYHNRRLRPSGQGQLKTSPGPETVFVLHQTSHHANWTNCVHGFFISSDILFRVDSSSRHLQMTVGKRYMGGTYDDHRSNTVVPRAPCYALRQMGYFGTIYLTPMRQLSHTTIGQ